MVVRFAEIQVHQNPKKCCLFIAEVIKSINPEYIIPDELQNQERISGVEQWTKDQALIWSIQKFREEYLGIESFGTVPETELLDDVQETDLGRLIEEEVIDEPPLFDAEGIQEVEEEVTDEPPPIDTERIPEAEEEVSNEPPPIDTERIPEIEEEVIDEPPPIDIEGIPEVEEDFIDEQLPISEEEITEQEVNPIIIIIQTALSEEAFISFIYEDRPTVVKPESVIDNSLTAYCYVKNYEREFDIRNISNSQIKQSPFIIEETGPDLELTSIQNIVNIAIQNNQYIRMEYSRIDWTNRWVDEETGEIIENHTEAETSVRTINDVQSSIDVLDEEHLDRYSLDENYITAYCNKRDEQRTFRLDRISEIAILDL